MAKKITSESGWSLPPSHDLGIKYTFHNLLKGNPVRERFFQQWLAYLDKINIERYYDYDTKKKKSSSPQGPTEVFYDQIQRMVNGANLSVKMEEELFGFLDEIHLKDSATIDFLRVKEFFAYCGIEGVYDIEQKKHFQMPYCGFVVDNLQFHSWPEHRIDEFRANMARMMAEPGEVPDYRKKIAELTDQRDILWTERYEDTEVSEKLRVLMKEIFNEEIKSPEHYHEIVANARERGFDLDVYDEEINAFNIAFDQSFESQDIVEKIRLLKEDEQSKLSMAMEKYASCEFIANPESFHAYDAGLSAKGNKWEREYRFLMNDPMHWAKVHMGEQGWETCSNEPLSAEEEETANIRYPHLVEDKMFNRARFAIQRDYYQEDLHPLVRSRYCAIEDWILRDFTLSESNRGELFKMRKEDIPVLFAEAMIAELGDGLLNSIKFPTRIEPLDDGSGRCCLVFQDEKVEIFHPDEIMPFMQSPRALERKRLMQEHHEQQNQGIIDFKLNAPASSVMAETGVPDPAEKSADEMRMEKANATKRDLHQRALAPKQHKSADQVQGAPSAIEDEPVGINADHVRDYNPKPFSNPAHHLQYNQPKQVRRSPLEKRRKAGHRTNHRSPGGMGGMPGIGMNFNFGAKEQASAEIDSGVDNVSAAREGLKNSQASHGKPTGTQKAWDAYSEALSGLKAKASQLKESEFLTDSADQVRKMSQELKKGLELFKNALTNNGLIQNSIQQCRAIFDDLAKTVNEMLKALQSIFGMGSPSHA